MCRVVLLCVAMTTTVVCVWGRSVHDVRARHVQARVNMSRFANHTSLSRKRSQHSLHNSSATTIDRHKHARKISIWRTMTNTLMQFILGDDDDDYDSSSSSQDDSSDSSGSSEHPTSHPPWIVTEKNTPRYLPEGRVQGTTVSPLEEEEVDEGASTGTAVEGKKNLTEAGGEGVVENISDDGDEGSRIEALAIDDSMYKMAARRDVQHNLLSSLADLKGKVEAAGRRLSFIEYVTLLEMVVLAFIAAGVFRTAYIPVSVPDFAKAAYDTVSVQDFAKAA